MLTKRKMRGICTFCKKKFKAAVMTSFTLLLRMFLKKQVKSLSSGSGRVFSEVAAVKPATLLKNKLKSRVFYYQVFLRVR